MPSSLPSSFCSVSFLRVPHRAAGSLAQTFWKATFSSAVIKIMLEQNKKFPTVMWKKCKWSLGYLVNCHFSRRYWGLVPSLGCVSAIFDLLMEGLLFAFSTLLYWAAKLEGHIQNCCHYLSVTLATGTGSVKSPFHPSRWTTWMACAVAYLWVTLTSPATALKCHRW